MGFISLTLYLLATLDAACIGYRTAAGRDARIDKRAYYRRALLVGALVGQGVVLLATGWLALLLASTANPAALLSDLTNAGRHMLQVFLPYAAVLLFAFAARLLPSVDVRCLTSILIFGPFTLIRPVVAVAGVAWAVCSVPRLQILLTGVFLLVLMLFLEPLFNVYRRRLSG